MNEAAYRKLISGDVRGLGPAMLRGGLSGLSLLYRGGVSLRNRAFDVGLKRVHQAAVPVISVGNLTTGGTGKTPFVAWLANWIRDRGLQPVILSRGYRPCKAAAIGRAGWRDRWSRLSNERDMPPRTNDEKRVLDQLCPGVPHLQNPDRVAAAERAVREHNADLLILDDGFQHRRLHRDLDIVLIDALNPFGHGHLLPRGLLREPMIALRRADLIVLTRADQCSSACGLAAGPAPRAGRADSRTVGQSDISPHKHHILEQLARAGAPQPVVEVTFVPKCLRSADGKTAPLDSLNGQPVLAFCGLGNPDGFRRTLIDAGINVAAFQTFPDHHHYMADDVSALEEQAQRHRAAAVLTTQKDLVKLDRCELAGVPLWAVQIGMEVLGHRAQLELKLQATWQRSNDRSGLDPHFPSRGGKSARGQRSFNSS